MYLWREISEILFLIAPRSGNKYLTECVAIAKYCTVYADNVSLENYWRRNLLICTKQHVWPSCEKFWWDSSHCVLHNFSLLSTIARPMLVTNSSSGMLLFSIRYGIWNCKCVWLGYELFAILHLLRFLVFSYTTEYLTSPLLSDTCTDQYCSRPWHQTNYSNPQV